MDYATFSKEQFRIEMERGILQYIQKNNSLEFLTVSISKNDPKGILYYFPVFMDRVKMYRKGYQFAHIEFIGVCVDSWHIHAFVKKPFVYFKDFYNMWDTVTSSESNLRITTDVKNGIADIKKLKNHNAYILTQSGDDLVYFGSKYWGIAQYEKKKKNPNFKTYKDITMTKEEILKSNREYNKTSLDDYKLG